jgi:hypothetical protein
MSFILWYLHKVNQCARLAKEAGDPGERSQFETERQLWLQVAEAEQNRESISLELMPDSTAAPPEQIEARESLGRSANSSGTKQQTAHRRLRGARRHETRLH